MKLSSITTYYIHIAYWLNDYWLLMQADRLVDDASKFKNIFLYILYWSQI